jgi:hypothetical protein
MVFGAFTYKGKMHKQFFFIRRFIWSSAHSQVANRQPIVVLQSRSEKNNRYWPEILCSFRFAFEPNSLNTLSNKVWRSERDLAIWDIKAQYFSLGPTTTAIWYPSQSSY